MSTARSRPSSAASRGNRKGTPAGPARDPKRLRRVPRLEGLERRTLLSSTDLLTFIENKLDAATSSPYSATFSPGDVSLGNSLLTINGPTVAFNGLSRSGSSWTGSVTVSADDAELQVGSALASTIQGVTQGAIGLTGTYTLNGSLDGAGKFQFSAAQFDAKAGSALDVHAAGVSLAYDPSAASGSRLSASIGGASATLHPFHDATVTLSGVTIGDSSFSVANGTFAAGSITLGNLVSVGGASVGFTNFGSGDGKTYAGSASLSATTASLFPGQGAFSASVGGFAGTYDFSTGALGLAATSVDLKVGSLIEARSTGGLTIAASTTDPSQYTFDARGITLSSPKFTGVTGSLTEIKGDASGFAISQADVTGSAHLGTLLEADGFDLSVSGLNYTASGHALSAASVSLSATTVALFPGQTAFTASVGGLSGHYDFNAGTLGLSAQGLDLRVGDLIEARSTGGLSIGIDLNDPSKDTFDAKAVALTSPRFSGVAGSLTDLSGNASGFTIGQADVTGSAHLGTLLEADGFDLSVSGLTYTQSGHSLAATSIGATATSVSLFPGQSAFSASVTGFAASYDLTANTLGVSAGSVDLKFGSILEANLTGLAFTDSISDPSGFTLNATTVGLSSPKFAGIGASLGGLAITSAGFSIGSADVKGDAHIGGALTIHGLDLNVTNLSYNNTNHALSANAVSLSAVTAELFPGSSAFGSTLTGLTFADDLTTGALSLGVTELDIKAGDLLDLDAKNVGITLTGDQFTVAVGTATATVPRLSSLSGTVTGLSITNTGFSIGGATLSAHTTLSLGGVLSVTDPSIGITNLSYRAGQGVKFDGDLSFAADSASFSLKKSGGGTVSSFAASANSLSGTIGLSSSDYGQFKFQAASVGLSLGTYLSLGATGVTFDTSPSATYLAEFGTLTATVSPSGSASLTGSAQHFAIAPDGTFITEAGFGVSLNLNSNTSSFKIPSWLPISVTALALQWPSFSTDPTDFTIDLSASVQASIPGTDLVLSGFVDNLVIDVGDLGTTTFPIIGLDGAGIGVSGDILGATVQGDLFLDLLKLDGNGNAIAPGDTTTPVATRAFYGGIDAGIDLEGEAGFDIRLGLAEVNSQVLPLSLFVQADVPIVIEPISGLTISGFRAGIEFGDSLPEITDPHALATISGFAPAGQQTLSQWKSGLETDLVNVLKNGSNVTLASLTQNFVLQGGVTLFSSYATTNAFELNADILLDRQGHVELSGDLVLGDTVHVDARAYFDFSQVKQGKASLLVYAQAPAPVDGSTVPSLVTAYGALSIVYASPVPASSQVPTGTTDPALGSAITFAGPSLGSAIAFAGNASASADHINLNGTDLTVEFWARRTGSNVLQDAVGQDKAANGLSVGFDAQNHVFARFGNQAVTGPADDGNWHHWAVSYVSATGLLTIYRDGQGVSSGTVAKGGLSGANTTFTVGRSGSTFFTGSVDEVRVWTVARSAADILANADRGTLSGQTGLVADWTFDEGVGHDGTTLADSSGNGNALKIKGNPSWTSVTFAASPSVSAPIAGPSGASILDATSLTVEFWAQRTASGVVQDVIGQDGGAANSGLVVGFDAGNNLFARYKSTTLTGPADDGNWHHWAVSYDSGSGTLTIYEDGHSVASQTAAAGGLSGSGTTFTIGRSGSTSFGGSVDEVRVWTVARSAADILANVNASGLAGSTGLAAEWTFDEGAGGPGATLADSSGHGLTATIAGTPSWSQAVHHPAPTPSATAPFGSLTILITGEVDLGVTVGGKLLGVQVLGSASLTAAEDPKTDITTLTLDVSGQLNLNPLGNLLDIAGRLTLDLSPKGVPLDMYGALVAEPGQFFSTLQNYGLAVDGFALVQINTTRNAISETLDIPGQSSPTTFTLDPQATSVWVHGTASFSEGGTAWFQVQGDLYMFLGQANGTSSTQGFQLDTYVNGILIIGPASNPILEFDAAGFFQISASGVAAEVDVSFAAGQGSALKSKGLDLTAKASFLLEMNTTGNEVTFALPTSLGGHAIPTLTGADGTPLASNIDLPASAPALPDGTTVAAGPYLFLDGQGDINLMDVFGLSGSFTFEVAPGVLLADFDATLTLNVPNPSDPSDPTKLLSATAAGGIQIDSQGIVGALAFSFDTSTGSGGFGLTVDASAELEVNSTGLAETIAGIPVPAGEDGFYATVAIGSQSAPVSLSLKAGSTTTTISGYFDLTVTGDSLRVDVAGTIDVSILGTLSVDGTLGIVAGDHAGVYAALSVDIGSSDSLSNYGLDFSADAHFQFEINTTDMDQQAIGFTVDPSSGDVTTGQQVTLPAQSFAVEVGAKLTLLGGSFEIGGDFGFSISSSQISLHIDGDITILRSHVGFDDTLTLPVGGLDIYDEFSYGAGLNYTNGGPGLSASGNLILAVNSTGSPIYHFYVDDEGHTHYQTVDPHSAFVELADGELKIGKLDIRADAKISYDDGVFGLGVDATIGDDYASLEGHFDFEAGVRKSTGDIIFSIDAGVDVYFLGGDLGGVDAGFSFDANPSKGTFDVKIHVAIPHLFDHTFDFGTSGDSIPTPAITGLTADRDVIAVGDAPVFTATVDDPAVGGSTTLTYAFQIAGPGAGNTAVHATEGTYKLSAEFVPTLTGYFNFDKPGTYTVNLYVYSQTTGRGKSQKATYSRTFQVVAQTPVLDQVIAARFGLAGRSETFTTNPSDLDGQVPTYHWTVTQDGGTVATADTATSSFLYTPATAGSYRVSATVSDAFGTSPIVSEDVLAVSGSTLTVNSLGDGIDPTNASVMTLPEAVAIADAVDGEDSSNAVNFRVAFDPSLSGRTITLGTIGGVSFGDSALEVDDFTTLTIDGSAAPGLTISRAVGAPAMRLFYVGTYGNLTLEDLTLSGGLEQGGDGFFGDIGGGGGGAGLGGALYNAGTVALVGCTLTGNEAQGGSGTTGDGAGDGTSVGGSPNGGDYGQAGGFGGGGGGGLNGSIPAPGAAGFGGGAGFNYVGGGGAGLGGAIFNDLGGSITVTDSTFTGNSAVGGGNAYNGDAFPGFHGYSTVGSGYGGAIFNRGGSLTLVNDTLDADSVSAGPLLPGSHVDLSQGYADGGEVYNLTDSSRTASLSLTNTILADSSGGSSDVVNNGGSVGGSHNLAGGFSGLATSGIFSGANGLNLPALANNGGPTRTQAIFASSSAARAGTANGTPATDQRGFALDSTPDIGAFQVGDVLTVNSLADTATPAAGTVTLREAVAIADALSPDDYAVFTIRFDPSLAGETIALSSIGDATIGASALGVAPGTQLVIDGSAAPGLTISRSSLASAMRIFYVAPGSSLTLEALTLAGGLERGSDGTYHDAAGGGGGGAGLGGALYNGGTVALVGCTLAGNLAQGGSGTAGDGVGPGASVGGSPNGGNYGQAGGFGGGGGGGGPHGPGPGARGFGGGSGSTYVGGGGAGLGGAIFNDPGGVLTVTDSTFTGNSATGGANAYNGDLFPGYHGYSQPGSGYGGAIFNRGGSITLVNDTLDADSARAGAILSGSDPRNAGSGDGGEVYNLGDSSHNAPLTMTNTILAGGYSATVARVTTILHDLVNDHGVVAGSHDLVTFESGTIRSGVILSTAAPQLGPLRDNGGPTRTMAIPDGSPAANAGTASGAPLLDQRGAFRSATPDIGAFDRSAIIVVNSNGDSATPASGTVTLREAVDLVDALAPKDGLDYTIEFSPSMAGQTITLATVGDATIGASALAVPAGSTLTIDGSAAPGLTIARKSSGPAMRLLYVAPGATLTLDDLALSGGLAQGGPGTNGGGGGAGLGGAIYNGGSLTILDATLTSNQAAGGAGAAHFTGSGGSPNGGNFGHGGGFGGGGGGGGSGTNPGPGGFGGGFGSTGTGGGGAGLGGAVFNDLGGVLTVTDSTLASNTATGGGSASTYFSGNQYSQAGSGYGGAIFSRDGRVALVGDALSYNTAVAGPAQGGPASTHGSSDGNALYVLQETGQTATLSLTNSVLGDNSNKSLHDVVDVGAAATGSGNLIGASTGLPSGIVAATSGLRLQASSGVASVGQAVTLSGEFLYPSQGPRSNVNIDWGDGSKPTQLQLGQGVLTFGLDGSVSHVYAANSWSNGGHAYTIAVSASGPSNLNATTTVVVNARPVTVAAGPTFQGAIGVASPVQTVATFTDPDGSTSNAGIPYIATVDWGDGTTSTARTSDGTIVLGPDNTTFSVRLAHTYASAGIGGGGFTVTTTVSHAGGLSLAATGHATIVTVPTPSALTISPDSGVSRTDGVTNTGTLQVSGSAAKSGLVVTLVDATTGATLSPLVITPGRGSTSFLATVTLAEGTHTLVATFTDPNSHAYATSILVVVVDKTPPSIASIGPVSPFATQSAVDHVDVTFSEPNFTPAAGIFQLFSLSRDGTSIAIPSSATLTPLSGSTYRLAGLSSLDGAEGAYTLTVNGRYEVDLAGNAGTGTMATTWVVDDTPPSSAVQPLAAVQTGYAIALSLAGSDPASSGVTASGIASFRVDVAVDGGAFRAWATVPAMNNAATASFPAQPGHAYAFRGVATDAAGNVEAKRVYAEAGTYVPDLTPPATSVSVTSVGPKTGLMTLQVTGTDVGGSGVASFAAYVQVDGGPFHKIAQVAAGTPDASGNYGQTFTYQGLADNQPHNYRFYSIGTDGAGNVEAVPGPSRFAVVNATFTGLPGSTGPQPLKVTKLVVQAGAAERSFIRTVDVDFNNANRPSDPSLSNLISGDRIRLVQHPLSGDLSASLATYDPASNPGLFKVIDHAIELDFGPLGLGGVARGSMSLAGYWSAMASGDGYYEVDLDLDGNGTFETHEFFYRLLGDVNGDHAVDQSDLVAISNALAARGAGLDQDVNGDGGVDGTDFFLATRSKVAQKVLHGGLRLDG